MDNTVATRPTAYLFDAANASDAERRGNTVAARVCGWFSGRAAAAADVSIDACAAQLHSMVALAGHAWEGFVDGYFGRQL